MLSIVILNRIDYSNNNNNIIDSNNITINEDTQRRSSSRKQWLCLSSLTNKYFVLPLILFILTLGILIVVLIERNTRINHLQNNLRINQNFIVETQNQNNQIEKQLKNQLLERNATIEHLQQTLVEMKQKRSKMNNHRK